jgi:hypothetical protein
MANYLVRVCRHDGLRREESLLLCPIWVVRWNSVDLIHEGDQVRVRHVDVRIPCLINGQPLRPNVGLRPGDRIQIGDDLVWLEAAPVIEPAWLAGQSRAIARLARAIRSARDFRRLPMLADALEDAGCGEVALLGHLRDPKHAGIFGDCWAIKLLLQWN